MKKHAVRKSKEEAFAKTAGQVAKSCTLNAHRVGNEGRGVTSLQSGRPIVHAPLACLVGCGEEKRLRTIFCYGRHSFASSILLPSGEKRGKGLSRMIVQRI